jgi:hypothetical protein
MPEFLSTCTKRHSLQPTKIIPTKNRAYVRAQRIHPDQTADLKDVFQHSGMEKQRPSASSRVGNVPINAIMNVFNPACAAAPTPYRLVPSGLLAHDKLMKQHRAVKRVMFTINTGKKSRPAN